jgi:hypothetical protein
MFSLPKLKQISVGHLCKCTALGYGCKSLFQTVPLLQLIDLPAVKIKVSNAPVLLYVI